MIINHFISQTFANYFHSLPLTIKSSIVRTNHNLLQFIPNNLNSMVLNYAQADEVVKIMKSLKRVNEKYALSVLLLKGGRDFIASFIAVIYNFSIDAKVYPQLLKIARVVPVHKNGSHSDISNYRPVSALQVLNKIFETLVYSRLISFISNNNLLNDYQHGFRQKCNTDTALLTLLNYVLPVFNN